MGNLQDELKKASLTGRKQQKKVAHQQRVRRKELGREGLAREEQERERIVQKRREEKRDKDRELELARQEKQGEKQADRQLEEILSQNALRRGIGGPRRFHYIDRNNRIPFLEVNDEVGAKLARGELAIVEVPGPMGSEVYLLPGKSAGRVQALEPEAIRFWNN